MAQKQQKQAGADGLSREGRVARLRATAAEGPAAEARPAASPARALQSRIANQFNLRARPSKWHITGVVLSLILALCLAAFSLMAML
jgi:hypothetical protein